MDEQEFLKETIISLRTLAVLVITGGFGIISFIISHLSDITFSQAFIIGGIGLLFLGVALFFTIWFLVKMVNKLRRK